MRLDLSLSPPAAFVMADRRPRGGGASAAPLITACTSPGPEKSAVRIYRFTLDWLCHIFAPAINTFTAGLMPLWGINKVTADKMRPRFREGEDW